MTALQRTQLLVTLYRQVQTILDAERKGKHDQAMYACSKLSLDSMNLAVGFQEAIRKNLAQPVPTE